MNARDLNLKDYYQAGDSPVGQQHDHHRSYCDTYLIGGYTHPEISEIGQYLSQTCIHFQAMDQPHRTFPENSRTFSSPFKDFDRGMLGKARRASRQPSQNKPVTDRPAITFPAEDTHSVLHGTNSKYMKPGDIKGQYQSLVRQAQVAFHSCGNDPELQRHAIRLFESREYRTHKEIPKTLAMPFLQSVFDNHEPSSGKGSRGAPSFYQCKWGSCTRTIDRILHAVEHIRTHAENRAHRCETCSKAYIRRNELTRHLRKGCKQIMKQSQMDVEPQKIKQDAQDYRKSNIIDDASMYYINSDWRTELGGIFGGAFG